MRMMACQWESVTPIISKKRWFMDFCGLKRYSIVSLLFLLCFCNAALAQEQPEFHVLGFEEKPFDRTANDERYKIVDGNTYYACYLYFRSGNHNTYWDYRYNGLSVRPVTE